MALGSPELDNKMRQYKRVLLSYADFKHAILASSYILEDRLHEKYPEESYVILEALNCSMIMAYCRPFSGNDARRGKNRIPDLPARLLSVLSDDEREVHDAVMADRNQVLAHSDSEALQVEPVVQVVGGKPMVIPVKNWGLAPLTEEATRVFNAAAEKLHLVTLEERDRLEPELLPYLRREDSQNVFEPSA
jgi:hypothetical protein